MKCIEIRFQIFILPVVLSIVLSGCANPYRLNYQDMLLKRPQSKSMLLEKPESPVPVLVTSADMQNDSIDMLESGYFLIGKVTFKSPPIDEKQAIGQAKRVGADVVLTKKDYVTTVTESVPIIEWLPDRRTTVSAQSTYQSNPSAQPSISRTEITQTVQGETYTQYVPQNTDYFNYSATFWKKTKPLKFGVLVQSLDEETKKRLQTNRGVVVKVVVRKTPAYNADILRGDIITQFSGEPIADPEDFFEKIRAHAGQQITVKIIRDGIPKNITLTLLSNQ
jgi:hypothetical protein